MAKPKLKTPGILKKLREDRDMSLEDVGKLLGVSRQYIFAIESAKVQKPIEYSNKFARKVNLTKAEKKVLKESLLNDLANMLTF